MTSTPELTVDSVGVVFVVSWAGVDAEGEGGVVGELAFRCIAGAEAV